MRKKDTAYRCATTLLVSFASFARGKSTSGSSATIGCYHWFPGRGFYSSGGWFLGYGAFGNGCSGSGKGKGRNEEVSKYASGESHLIRCLI